MGHRVVAGATSIMLALLITPTQAADFDDNDYHEYLLYDVDTPQVDVLIVPPASPYYARDVVSLEKSVQAWDDGVNALGPAWLADGLNIDLYTLGYDVPPAAALADPEVVIFTAEYNPVLLFGIGLEPYQNVFTGQTPCHGLDPMDPTDWHNHIGSPWASARCDNGGMTCVVINTNFLWLPDLENEINMYDLNAHEFGHCLGIGHVGDALDFSARNYPAQDIMSYQHDPDQAHCVSTLNIRALEATYGNLLGHPELQQAPDTFVSMAPSQYSWVNCINPNGDWLDATAALPVGHEHPEPGSTIAGGSPPPPPPPASPPTDLTATKGTQGKNNVVALAWSGGASSVDIVVNSNLHTTVSNSGSYTHNVGKAPSGSFAYKVCNAATLDCSNTVTVTY